MKALLVTALAVILFTIYVGILIYGENSLSVLNQLKDNKINLEKEAKRLKLENQEFQKEYFEFKQLVPKKLPDGAL